MNDLTKFLSNRDTQVGDILVTRQGIFLIRSVSMGAYLLSAPDREAVEFYSDEYALQPYNLYRPSWSVHRLTSINLTRPEAAIYLEEVKPSKNSESIT